METSILPASGPRSRCFVKGGPLASNPKQNLTQLRLPGGQKAKVTLPPDFGELHAPNRRAGPLHRWLMDDAATAQRGHLLRPGAMLVGHQPCSTCRGGHTTWTCLDCGAVVYRPPLSAGCRILVGAAAVR